MNNILQDLMHEATQLTQAGRLSEATEVIQRALNGAPRTDPVSWHTANTDVRTVRRGAGAAVAAVHAPLVLDGCVFEVDARAPVEAATVPAEEHAHPDAAVQAGQGQFTGGTHTHLSQTRRYKLYTPPGHFGRQLPLIVMLHGCTQDPDDFAAGTGMNERAREQGFFVLYPAQSQEANPSRCWNWFKDDHQRRDRGEPALLASMTQTVIEQHDIDVQRVFIAGMSAGGAMAAIVSAAYPEIFAAAGVHSGLPPGAARDVAGALSVMKRGGSGSGLGAKVNGVGTRQAEGLRPGKPVPTIVFHGDQDRTVHPRNGEQLIAAVLGSASATREGGTPDGNPQMESGVSTHGQRYTRSTHRGLEGDALAEHWIVHGSGHAWSGGDAKGTYTDARGPDATREMLRFFFSREPHG